MLEVITTTQVFQIDYDDIEHFVNQIETMYYDGMKYAKIPDQELYINVDTIVAIRHSEKKKQILNENIEKGTD